MNLPARALFLTLSVLILFSAARWLPSFLQELNFIPVFLYLLLKKKRAAEGVFLGALAGGLMALVFPGPPVIAVLRYAFEGFVAGRLRISVGASVGKLYGFLWMIMGVDLGMGMLSRLILDNPLTVDLLKDWLMMDAISGALGMLFVFLGRHFGGAGGFRSQKHHGIGLPLS